MYLIGLSNSTSSNGMLDDYSPAQPLNKALDSSHSTRTTTNTFTSVTPTSHTILLPSTSAHTNSASNHTDKSSKVSVSS